MLHFCEDYTIAGNDIIKWRRDLDLSHRECSVYNMDNVIGGISRLNARGLAGEL